MREEYAVAEWEHDDIACRVVKMPMGHYCGYVQLPEGLREDFGREDTSLRVHGGLTYGPDADGWVGFDTGHGWDVNLDENGEQWGVWVRMPPIPAPEPIGATVWTVEGVVGEVEQLAEQVAEARVD